MGKGVPLHRQVFLVVRDQILQGHYRPGDALPIEEELCQQFGVSRITIRRAIGDLVNLKLLSRRHAQGTFVQQHPSLARRIPSLSFIEGLKKSAVETTVRVLDVSNGVPPYEVAQLLSIPAGEQALRVHRLRSIGNEPVLLSDSWIVAEHSRGVTRAALRKRALFDLLVDNGVVFGRMIQEITASAATPQASQLMQVEVGAPLLRLVRVMHDADDQAVQYLQFYLSPDRSRILTDIPGEWINTMNAGQVVHDAALF
jgi:GntR family transcriptional regulator